MYIHVRCFLSMHTYIVVQLCCLAGCDYVSHQSWCDDHLDLPFWKFTGKIAGIFEEMLMLLIDTLLTIM